MARKAGKRDPDKVSTVRDGAAGIAAGTAVAAYNIIYLARDDGFTQPATWVRVVILIVAAALAALAWAAWLRGRPVRNLRHMSVTFGVPMAAALVMYLAAALLMIHLRSLPVDVTLADRLAGYDQGELDDTVRGLVELDLLVNQDVSLRHEDLDIDFAFYEDRERPDSDYVWVAVLTAEEGSSRAQALADDFDHEITAGFLSSSAISEVGEGMTVEGHPGVVRCGTVTAQGESASLCAYAHGVRGVLIDLPTDEEQPRSVATAMLRDMLSA